jgi:hypothetical protein
MLGRDTVLAKFDSKAGVVRPAPLFTSVCQLVEKFKPALTIVGNRVNIFSVNQNEDSQARQCLNMLNSIIVEYGTTVVMPGHVSAGQLTTGTGSSGSVQWSMVCGNVAFYGASAATRMSQNRIRICAS